MFNIVFQYVFGEGHFEGRFKVVLNSGRFLGKYRVKYCILVCVWRVPCLIVYSGIILASETKFRWVVQLQIFIPYA